MSKKTDRGLRKYISQKDAEKYIKWGFVIEIALLASSSLGYSGVGRLWSVLLLLLSITIIVLNIGLHKPAIITRLALIFNILIIILTINYFIMTS